MKPYTIILADDHAMMRDGIRNLIDAVNGLEVVAEAADGLELLRIIKKTVPDMVILDISMPGLRGIEAAREILTLHPQVDILILSMHKREEFLAMALAAGAKGYILKEDTGEELLLAIERVRQGRTYLSARLVNAFPSDIISICRGNHADGANPLTYRERQVLQLIAEGHTDRQISEKLHISLRTVHHHHANIKSKLSLKRTADLVRYAISEGYIANQT
jgi:DNA-binding NarL/FixJ family response regulator